MLTAGYAVVRGRCAAMMAKTMYWLRICARLLKPILAGTVLGEHAGSSARRGAPLPILPRGTAFGLCPLSLTTFAMRSGQLGLSEGA